MESSNITKDILLFRDETDRALLVRGGQHATAIDIPADSDSASRLETAGLIMAPYGVKTAILTHEPIDKDLPLEKVGATRLVRADRHPELAWQYDIVPPAMLRHPDISVHLVRDQRRLYDDTGRSFVVEPCVGDPHSLAVMIEPENMLVVCEDLHPDLPPRVHPGAVRETIARLRSWQARSPEVIVPASGIPIAGDQAHETLEKSIQYLLRLDERMRVALLEARFPWERLIYTISWCDVWDGDQVSPALVSRHRDNIRDMACDIWQRVIPDTPPVHAMA